MGKRNGGLDLLRLVCALMVLTIHTDYYGKLYIEPMTRLAVPVFFMISGYCYVFKPDKKGQILKLLGLTLAANGLYALWSILLTLVDSGSVGALVRSWFTVTWLERFLLYNRTPAAEHLWYLGAQLYVLVIVAAVDKVWDRRKLYPLIPVLLTANLLLGNYADLALGLEIPRMVTRNYLFMGLPCFLLGDLLREYGGRIRGGSAVWTAVLILSWAAVQLERVLLARYSTFLNQDFFISTIFSAAALFLLAQRNGQALSGGGASKLATAGRRYSLDIYIWHPILIEVLTRATETVSARFPAVATVYYFVAPAVNFGAALALAMLLSRLRPARGR